MAKQKFFKKGEKSSKKELLSNLQTLFDFIPPDRLSKKLRHIFLSYLRHESHLLPDDIQDTIAEMEMLMEFLDEVRDEKREMRKEK